MDLVLYLSVTNYYHYYLQAADMVPYLRKFALGWATSRFARTYWHNKRGRISAMGNPNSSQFQKALKTSPKFRAEYEARVAAGVFANGPLGMFRYFGLT